jgi:hypothetical protein
MKRLLALALVLTGMVTQLEATPFLPHLNSLQVELTAQLETANNAEEPDPKLITALRKALTQLTRTTPTNLLNDVKALASISATLSKSSASNTFGPLLEDALSAYLQVMLDAGVTLSNRLNASFPSKTRTAAEGKLALLFDQIEAASTTANLAAAAKLAAKAPKTLVVSESLVSRAEDAPAPPARITARVTGAVNMTINTTGAGIVAGHGLVVNGAQPMGAGFKQINFSLLAVPEGTHQVNVAFANVNTLQFPGIARNWGNGTGTATVTRNNAHGTAFGTFTFTATGLQGTAGTITVTGEFSGSF